MGLLQILDRWLSHREYRRIYKNIYGYDPLKDLPGHLSVLMHEGGNIDKRQKPWLAEFSNFIKSLNAEELICTINNNHEKRITYALFVMGASSNISQRENLNEIQATLIMSNCLLAEGFSARNVERSVADYKKLIEDDSIKSIYDAGFNAMAEWQAGNLDVAKKALTELLS